MGYNQIKMGIYDLEAHKRAAAWARDWLDNSVQYAMEGRVVAPCCPETILEALRPILPIKVDRIEDYTIGLGCGFSLTGEVCGAISGHIIAIGIDISSYTRETALIRDRVLAYSRKYMYRFREKFGHWRCGDLLGFTLTDPDGLKKLQKRGEQRPNCLDYIEFAIMEPLPSEEPDTERNLIPQKKK